VDTKGCEVTRYDDGHTCPPCTEFEPWSACSEPCCSQWSTYTDECLVKPERCHSHVIIPNMSHVEEKFCALPAPRECETCEEQRCPTPAPTTYPTASPTASPETEEKIRGDTVPFCNVLDGDFVTLDASRDRHYVDAGATCSDDFDGNINRQIRVEGQVVDLALVGTYNIIYTCKNLVGKPAVPCTRVVTIKDLTCPTCSMNEGPTRIEASFPYYDSGAICTDTMDGVMAVTTLGVEDVNVERTGTYVITYQTRDSQKNWNNGSPTNVGAPLPDGITCKGAKDYFRTVIVVDTLMPVIHLNYTGKLIQTGLKGPVSNTGIKWTNPIFGNRNSASAPAPVYGALMTEATSTRGIAGVVAVGSGAVGLALIVAAAWRKRTTTITTIDV